MRRTFALVGLLLVAVGCGGEVAGPSPEDVVRTWSEALNAGNNDGAADVFAPGARVIQGNRVWILRTHDDAARWNAGLPCSGRIVSIKADGDTVTATFLLGDRPASRCDSPGGTATALFRIREGLIVLWHQTGSEPPPEPA